MYRTPNYLWRSAKSLYERKFRRKVPQWVLSLDLNSSLSLLNLSYKLNWKLNPKMLFDGELHEGSGSLWDNKYVSRYDHKPDSVDKK